MDRKRLAEEKFRPLKQRMRGTVQRLKAAARAGTLPERGVVAEFVDQVRVMVSYPGFGDAAYPDFVEASEALNQSATRHDLDGYRQALANLLALQERCHAGQTTPPPLAGARGGGT